MIIGPLEKGPRRIRVWQDELPCTFASSEVLKQKISSTKRGSSGPAISIAVEMSLFTSPRFQYGLLGASFRPEESDDLLVSIAIMEAKGQPFRESIGWKRDNCYWGLPTEYAGAVLKAVTSCKPLTGAGKLDFHCAAHAEISSNQVIFACLGQILMTAFEQQLTADSIADVAFRQSLEESAALLRHGKSGAET